MAEKRYMESRKQTPSSFRFARRPFCKSNFTVGFFVPLSISSPPAPSNPALRIIELPKQTYYVLQVSKPPHTSVDVQK